MGIFKTRHKDNVFNYKKFVVFSIFTRNRSLNGPVFNNMKKGRLNFDEFQKIDAQQWQQKLLADLKGKPIPTVQKGGFVLNPFLTKTKDTQNLIRPKKNGAWKMSISFDLKDSERLNAEILNGLQLGIQDVVILWHDALDETIVFRDVHREMINIDIRKDSDSIDSVYIQNDGDYVDAFRRIEKNAKAPETPIELVASKDFILNIAFIRATKMFLTEKNLNNPIRMIPDYSKLDEDLDIQCIEKTMIGLAGVLASVDILELAKVEHTSNQNDYHRINHMIHHILREESHLSRVHDPLAGSYFIEELCHKILQKSKGI